jgi:DNA-binding transcriptional MocR family regulator
MMKKINRILREILYRVYERNEPFMSQRSLGQACETSIDTVNRLVSKLHQFGSIEKKPLGFRVTNPKKVLLYWASTRNLANDIVYSTYSPDQVSEIEEEMPPGTIFTGYSGYRLRFKDVPTYYEEVYVYADPDGVKRKFPEKAIERKNVFVLKSDPHLKKVSKNNAAPLAQIYVDLWQIGEATSERFVLELEKKLEPKPSEILKALTQK